MPAKKTIEEAIEQKYRKEQEGVKSLEKEGEKPLRSISKTMKGATKSDD